MTPKPSRHSKRPVPPAQDDHIRIVPLFLPRELLTPAPGILAPPAAELTYRGGPLITAVQVFTAFWGQAWNAAAQQTVITTLNDFFRFIVASAYVDQLSEYNTPEYTIGRGRVAETPTVTASEPGTN